MIYRAGIDLAGSPDPETSIEKTFATNGWGGMWRNGIYPYVHYHSMIHEAMGIARGRARVRFGGEHGREIDLTPGDVVILPAGTGHQGLSHTPDLVVIGAYPPVGNYNLCRGSRSEHAAALDLDSPRAAAADRPGVRRRRPADRIVAIMITDWQAFWDGPHFIYVSTRHKDVHYRRIAEAIVALVPGPDARVSITDRARRCMRTSSRTPPAKSCCARPPPACARASNGALPATRKFASSPRTKSPACPSTRST